jgi:hypothetical protein
MKKYGGVEVEIQDSSFGHQMEVSGHFHAPAASPPGKEPPVSIGYQAWRAPEAVWTLWSRENTLVPAGIRTPAVQSATGRYTDWDIPAPN